MNYQYFLHFINCCGNCPSAKLLGWEPKRE